ncbi:MAG: CCA tRNA nucleotidyltransferase [Phycisphaerales bacterium]
MSKAREVAVGVVRALTGAGHQAYFAGGCVRDELLGREPDDYDVATSAHPEQVRAVYPKVNEVGVSFGVLLVKQKGEVVEVATFREEGVYSDKRRPDEVRFSTAEADARRRDFTINALFLDPLSPGDDGATVSPLGGRVIDFVGGIEDLRAKRLRAVGNAGHRLEEDHLRALRGVRLAARLGFTIEESTGAAMRARASGLDGVSRERVGEEMRKMLSHPSRAEAVRVMTALGLDAPALQEEHVECEAQAVGGLPEGADVATALGAWAIDRAGLEGCAGVSARWREALCLSNEETEALSSALRGVGVLEKEWGGLGVAGRKRAASSAWFGRALAIVNARNGAWGLRIEEDVAELSGSFGGLAPEAWVSGDDLIAMGMKPGPRFREVLEAVYDAQLEGRVRTRQEALEEARRRGM